MDSATTGTRRGKKRLARPAIRDRGKDSQTASSHPKLSGPEVSDSWSVADRRKGAELLLQIVKYLASLGVRSLHDPRVPAEMRKLSGQLIEHGAIEELPIEDLGRIWEYVETTKATVICGTKAARNNERADQKSQKHEEKKTSQQLDDSEDQAGGFLRMSPGCEWSLTTL